MTEFLDVRQNTFRNPFLEIYATCSLRSLSLNKKCINEAFLERFFCFLSNLKQPRAILCDFSTVCLKRYEKTCLINHIFLFYRYSIGKPQLGTLWSRDNLGFNRHRL